MNIRTRGGNTGPGVLRIRNVCERATAMMCPEPPDFVAFDLETTGLAPQTERIIEIGAVRFRYDGQELARFQALVNPGRPIPAASQRIHGISDADVADAPGIAVVLPEFLAWLGPPASLALVAHNARFDASFLCCELDRIAAYDVAHDVFDTLHLARRRLPHLHSHRLDYLARELRLDRGGSHRALTDSLRVKALWIALKGYDHPPMSYHVSASPAPPAVPKGWDGMAAAVGAGKVLRIRYEGGSRGNAPRDITPQRFVHKGGVVYLVATCHLDRVEKSFRLDRVLHFEVIEPRKRHTAGPSTPAATSPVHG